MTQEIVLKNPTSLHEHPRFAGILACMGLVWIWSVGGTKSRFI